MRLPRREWVQAQMARAVHGSDMHALLVARGFVLMPFRLPRRSQPEPMKVRAVWKRTAAGIQEIVRYDFAISGKTAS